MHLAEFNKNYTQETQETQNNNKKTRMCKHAKNCSRGDHCNFAHTVAELQPRECHFRDNCRHPEKCQFIHPWERKEDFLNRLGLKDVVKEIKEIKAVKPKNFEKAPNENPWGVLEILEDEEEEDGEVIEVLPTEGAEVLAKTKTQESQVDLVPKFKIPKMVLKNNKTPPKVNIRAPIIRCKKELAMEMLTLAIKNGVKNIKIEIIEEVAPLPNQKDFDSEVMKQAVDLLSDEEEEEEC